MSTDSVRSSRSLKMERTGNTSNCGQAAHSHVPHGKEGEAFYSKVFFKTAMAYLEKMWPNVDRCLDEIIALSSDNEPIVIADYGSCDGGVSMPLVNKIVGKIRQQCGPNKEILVCYEDQASNDFKALFSIVTGQKQIGPEASCFSRDDRVFYNAVGRSFYSQCFPSNFIDLALSSTSFHWMKDPPPRPISKFVSMDDKGSKVEALSVTDWETIMLLRAKEMKGGSMMVVAELSRTDDGYLSGGTETTTNPVYQVLFDEWTGLRQRDSITEEEYQKFVLAVSIRSSDELRQPFTDPDSKVMKAGLRLVSMETKITNCPLHAEIEENLGKDPHEYAKVHVGVVRSWSNYSFLSALSESRSIDERNRIVEEMFKRYEDRVASDPLAYKLDYLHQFIVIRKIKR